MAEPLIFCEKIVDLFEISYQEGVDVIDADVLRLGAIAFSRKRVLQRGVLRDILQQGERANEDFRVELMNILTQSGISRKVAIEGNEWAKRFAHIRARLYQLYRASYQRLQTIRPAEIATGSDVNVEEWLGNNQRLTKRYRASFGERLPEKAKVAVLQHIIQQLDEMYADYMRHPAYIEAAADHFVAQNRDTRFVDVLFTYFYRLAVGAENRGAAAVFDDIIEFGALLRLAHEQNFSCSRELNEQGNPVFKLINDGNPLPLDRKTLDVVDIIDQLLCKHSLWAQREGNDLIKFVLLAYGDSSVLEKLVRAHSERRAPEMSIWNNFLQHVIMLIIFYYPSLVSIVPALSQLIIKEDRNPLKSLPANIAETARDILAERKGDNC
ncbi:MAG: hypothetical protein HY817_04110 [Candidatus Abawacabacteria bacterium]|nr:hypothetical protein [Candidatus Abawacabacteria bacterium]